VMKETRKGDYKRCLRCDSGANLTRRVEAALSRRLDVCGRSVSRSKESDVYVELDEDVM